MNPKEIVKLFGTPLYVYNEDEIIRNYNLINNSLLYPHKKIHFAVMCNNRLELLKILSKTGCGVQINSMLELKLVKKAGFRKNQISFTSTGLDVKTIKKLVDENIQLNLDSIEELEKYCAINPNSKVGIRIKMKEDIELPDTHTNTPKDSNIGIHPRKFNSIKVLAKKNNIKINGIHGYLASNILEVKPFLESADYLKDCATAFPDLEYINFGSGYGISENSGSKSFDFNKLGAYYNAIGNYLSRHFGKDIEIKLEPGRTIIGSAGDLYSRITNIKQLDEKKQLAIDVGFAEYARPLLYNSCISVISDTKSGKSELYDLRANTVLQNDFLAKNITLPKLNEGDVLIIKNTGAYGIVMASGFPGKKIPSEVLIKSSGELCKI